MKNDPTVFAWFPQLTKDYEQISGYLHFRINSLFILTYGKTNKPLIQATILFKVYRVRKSFDKFDSF